MPWYQLHFDTFKNEGLLCCFWHRNHFEQIIFFMKKKIIFKKASQMINELIFWIDKSRLILKSILKRMVKIIGYSGNYIRHNFFQCYKYKLSVFSLLILILFVLIFAINVFNTFKFIIIEINWGLNSSMYIILAFILLNANFIFLVYYTEQ